jgi:hypothetical protein
MRLHDAAGRILRKAVFRRPDLMDVLFDGFALSECSGRHEADGKEQKRERDAVEKGSGTHHGWESLPGGNMETGVIGRRVIF